MRQRTLTAIVMALFMIPIVIFGDKFYIFPAFCLLLSIAATVEFRKMLRHKHEVPFIIDLITLILSIFMFIIFYLSVTRLVAIEFFVLYLVINILIFFTLFIFVEEFEVNDLGNAFTTILYTTLGFVALAFLRDQGLIMIIYLLAVSIFTDTFAYLFGVKFGKHKIAPKISPKKSVEGSIAGLVLGSLLATLFAYLFDVFSFSIFYVLILSILLSVIAQIGDLVASKFKRDAGIKDYSNIFPGHGGVLDRFDSAMFAALHLAVFLLILGLS
jgi:phosphatidate cytidylyltransferase